MHNRRCLSATQTTIRDEIANRLVHRYRLELREGGELAVRMPGPLSQEQAIEVVDQLRELAFAVATSAGLSEHEALAREALARTCEELRDAGENEIEDLATARRALASYGRLRDTVSEFLRVVGR